MNPDPDGLVVGEADDDLDARLDAELHAYNLQATGAKVLPDTTKAAMHAKLTT